MCRAVERYENLGGGWMSTNVVGKPCPLVGIWLNDMARPGGDCLAAPFPSPGSYGPVNGPVKSIHTHFLNFMNSIGAHTFNTWIFSQLLIFVFPTLIQFDLI